MTAATSGSLTRHLSPPARLAFALVRLYQRITADRPSPCRYVPTCSNYALDALEVHGFVRGLWLTTRRIGRCHPWAASGWDPVPPASDHRHHADHDHRHGATDRDPSRSAPTPESDR